MNLNENSVNSTNSASKKLASKFIKKSPVIIFRNRFSRLVAYLISSMPLQKSLHSIVSVIRLLQILFVSLFFGNKKLWVPGTLEYKTGDILSIVFRPWPQNTSFYSYTIFGWISLALTIYIVPMEIVMSIIFRQKGTLSQKLVHFWSFITSSVEFIIYPMMGCNLGHLIGNFVNDSDVTPTPYLIALTTMLIIVLVVNLYINNLINAACVTFVSTSIPTIDISCQPKSVIVMTIICFIQELSCNLDNAHIVRIILMVINICLQTVHYAIFDILGMIIDDFDLLLFKTVSCVGWSNSILALILYCLNSRMGIWFIIVDFCLGLLYFVVFYIEQKRRDAKVLATIDSIHDDPGNIVNFKRYLDFAKSSFIGFKNNHPYCINFQIFIDYCREFPEEQRALMLFAKFISMYPKESSQLQHIYISLKRNKQHTMRYKSVMKQIQMILLKRDATLRPELKREIEAANQLVTTCKLRLRMIWEAVLEGSTRDLGSYFRRFDEPYMEIQRAFANFRNYHPNSPYATSLCASIAQDIMRDPQLAEEMQNEADHLSKGKFLNSDSVQIAAFIQFPSVPHLSQGRFTHQADYVSIYSSDKDEMNVFNEEDHEFAENLEILKYIKEIISQVRSPSAGFIRVFVMFYTIISLLCLWASIYVIPSLLSKIIIPANVFTSSLYLNMEIKISYGLTFRIFLENIGIIKNECNEAMFNYTTNKENIGGTCSSTEQIEYFASHIIDISEDYERMFDFIEIPALKQVRDMFFESSHLNYEYTSNTTRQLSPASPHQQLMDFSKRCIHLANLEANKFWDFVGMGLFGSLVANAQNLSDTILEMCTVIENYIIRTSHLFQNYLSYFMFAAFVICIILYTILAIFMTRWIGNNEKTVYDCFAKIPKATISKVIEKLDNKRKITESNNEEAALISNSKEQKAIAVFRSGKGTSINMLNVKFNVFLFFFIFQLFLVMVLIYISLNDAMVKYRESYMQIRLVARSFIRAMDAVSYEMIMASIENGYNDTITNWSDIVTKNCETMIESSLESFSELVFGNVTEGRAPIGKYIGHIYNSLNQFNCEVGDFHQLNDHDIYKCYPNDSIFLLLLAYVQRAFRIYTLLGNPIDIQANVFVQPWHMIMSHLYMNFFNPLFLDYDDTINSYSKATFMTYLLWASAITIFSIALCILFQYISRVINDQIKNMLKCFLYIPSDILMRSNAIMKIMSGDFSSDGSDVLSDSQVYESLFKEFTDGIIVVNKKKEIVAINKIAHEIIGDVSIIPNEFQDEKENLFYGNRNWNVAVTQVNEIESAIVITDISEIVHTIDQIEEQKKILNEILVQIFPKQVIEKTVDNQEVSFLVSSATVLSVYVKNIEDSAKIKEIMEKKSLLKTNISVVYSIGNCFMAVAGIFAEVNISEAHAREITDYSSEVFQELKNEKIEIQMGISSGGPLICCVVKLESPLFEIYGSPVEMAQEMAYCGVPDSIHITRSVYELIYGGKHQIRERGEVPLLKYGKVVTYLISTDH